MQKIHDELLTCRLETAIDVGMVFIHWSELRRWYDMQRITVTVFRDLIQRWEHLTSNKKGELISVRGPENEGLWLFSEKSVSPVKEL